MIFWGLDLCEDVYNKRKKINILFLLVVLKVLWEGIKLNFENFLLGYSQQKVKKFQLWVGGGLFLVKGKKTRIPSPPPLSPYRVNIMRREADLTLLLRLNDYISAFFSLCGAAPRYGRSILLLSSVKPVCLYSGILYPSIYLHIYPSISQSICRSSISEARKSRPVGIVVVYTCDSVYYSDSVYLWRCIVVFLFSSMYTIYNM